MPQSEWHNHKVTKPVNDSDYFERMCRVIFMSGLNWRILEKKWPGIQKAFANFDVDTVASFKEEDVEELMMNADVIRNLSKIRAIIKNAKEIQSIKAEFGSFEKYLADLRSHVDEDGLCDSISKRFAFLGKGTTPIFLFYVSEDLPKTRMQWEERHKQSGR